MNEEQQNEYFDRYLRDDLNDEDKRRFEDKLRQDDVFKSAFEAHVQATKVVDLFIAENLRDKFAEWKKDESATIRPIRRRRWLIPSVAAASFLVLALSCGYLFVQQQFDHQQIAHSRMRDAGNSRDTKRGALNTTDKHLVDVLRLVEQKKLKLAEEKLDAIETDSTNRVSLQYIRGLIAFQSEDYSEALNYFQRVQKSDNAVLPEYADYGRLLALIAMSSNEDVLESAFDDILAKKRHFFRNDALVLQKKLHSKWVRWVN